MKKLVLFIFTITLFSACKKDNVCTITDFAGTWKGKKTCTLQSPVDVTVTVKQSGNKIEIEGGSLSSTVADVNDCEFNKDNTIFGVGEKIDGSISNNTMNMTLKTGVSALAVTCSFSLTKL